MAWRFAATGLAGFVVGAIVVSCWAVIRPGPSATEDLRDQVHTATMPRAELARALFDRVAPTFVGDTRVEDRRVGYVAFIAQPKLYGRFMCSVDAVSLPWKSTKLPRGAVPFPNVSFDTGYGIRRAPDAPQEEVTDLNVPCAHYRDFDHLISGDGLAIDRAVSVLNKAMVRARSNQGGFVLKCADDRDGTNKPCDGGAILRTLNLKDIDQVEAGDVRKSERSAEYADRIWMNTTGRGHGCHGGADTMIIRVVSLQTFGRQAASDGEPTEIDIRRGYIC